MVSVSVVIPAHNEEDYLEDTIRSVRRQSVDCEVIVVANDCSDDTVEVGKGLADRVFSVNERSVSLARNLGALFASGELLIFLDADTCLEPGAVVEAINELGKDEVGVFRGVFDSDGVFYSLIEFSKGFLHGSGLYAGSSGCILVYRSGFFRVGGFGPEDEPGEDRSFLKRCLSNGLKYNFLSDTGVVTSSRRYKDWGVFKLGCFWLLSKLGFDLEKNYW